MLIIRNLSLISVQSWNERNLTERFAKNSNFYSMDFLHFFAKRGNSVEKMTHRKKTRGHRASKIVKSTQSYRWPFALLLFTLLLSARARCMTCKFRAQLGCAEIISANVI